MTKDILRYLMVAAYVGAGIYHFIQPRGYMKIMPPWLPAPLALVYISGACEILFALLLLPAATRAMGAWLIILLLIAVFPANVQMAIDWQRKHHPKLWIAYARLPLQILFIYWAWIFTR